MRKQRIINQIVKAVLEVIEADKIILFGSQASEKATSDSDYDILVIKDVIENERTTLKKLYRKMIEVDAAVDILLKSSEGIDKSKNRLVSVTKEALDTGIVIYE